MRIEKIVSINGYTLIVFYSPADCYQFSIVGPDGDRFEPNDIFYAAAAAEEEGRRWISAD